KTSTILSSLSLMYRVLLPLKGWSGRRGSVLVRSAEVTSTSQRVLGAGPRSEHCAGRYELSGVLSIAEACPSDLPSSNRSRLRVRLGARAGPQRLSGYQPGRPELAVTVV